MENTVKVMLESEFGFDTKVYSRNKQAFCEMEIVTEEVRQLTGFTPEKVTVLNDGNNIYIEFAGNLERLMQDGGYDIQEALSMVMIENNIAAMDANIILDESCIDRIDLDALCKVVGKDHIFRK